MGMDRRLFVASLFFVGTLAVCLAEPCFCQGYTPSEMQQSGGPAESIEPDYQYSRNIAIRKQISTSGYCAGLEIFETDSSSILVVPEDNKFRFWDVTDVDVPIELGVIEGRIRSRAGRRMNAYRIEYPFKYNGHEVITLLSPDAICDNNGIYAV